MSGGIYLIHSDGRLVEISEQGYNSEDLLQGFLADIRIFLPKVGC
jgi:hypothetical protein